MCPKPSMSAHRVVAVDQCTKSPRVGRAGRGAVIGRATTGAVLLPVLRCCDGSSAVITPRYNGEAGRSRRLAQALADHRRDAVAAHGDAVQRVADLHGALLMGDHQELVVLAQLL